jgi:hypothetical protein
MDAAINAAVEANTKRLQDNARAVRDAENEVRDYVGSLAIACDSAADVYHAAFKILGVEGVDSVKEVPALKAILKAQPKPNERRSGATPLAMDAKSVSGYNERFPDAARIGNLG